VLGLAPAIAAAIVSLQSGAPPLDVALAKRYFQEAEWISNDDGGKLWGKKLYGPMLFVDAESRNFISNSEPPEGDFKEESGVYKGRLTDQIAIANTATEWAGKRWTIVLWPLPDSRTDRSALMMHELYHRIQPDLRLVGSSPQNAQMESLPGRLWLQLEIKALSAALLATSGPERDRNARHALGFRQMRYRKFPAAKAEEDQLEINEGLAEFTGYSLRGSSEAESRMWLGNQLRQSLGRESYARGFAYLTGPAYGLLLNVGEATRDKEVRWRTKLTSRPSLADLLSDFYGSPNWSSAQVLASAKPYGYTDLLRPKPFVRRSGLRASRRFARNSSTALPCGCRSLRCAFRSIRSTSFRLVRKARIIRRLRSSMSGARSR
jgi:hypothetical protein